MERKSKQNNFCAAVDRLKEAVAAYLDTPENTLFQDAAIQRFEFTFELSWKSLKEYLVDQGFSDQLNSPKQVLKEAYAAHVISDSEIWNDMLQSRNLTSHVYDEETSRKIAQDIAQKYLPVLERLKDYYQTT